MAKERDYSHDTLGLSDEDLNHLPEPISFSDATISRRKSIGLLVGGGLSLMGGTTLVGASLFTETSEIPQRVNNPTEKENESSAVVEPIVRSIKKHGRVYFNKDEIQASIITTPGASLGFSIVGSDALQHYERNARGLVSDSGIERVSKDGLEYIRFTLRPSENKQYLRSTMRVDEEIIDEVYEELPSVLQKYPKPGRIVLYHENLITRADIADDIHAYYNKFDFLFPEHPPFLTIRATLYDEPLPNLFPINHAVISPEIPLSEVDVETNQDDYTRFIHIKRLIKVYYNKIYTMHPGETEPSTDEFLPLKTLEATISDSFIPLTYNRLDYKRPVHWPPSVKFNMTNFIFHPGTYSPEVDNSKIPFMNSSENFLTTLLFLSQDEKKMEEFRRRIDILNNFREESPNSMNPSDAVRGIIRDGIKILQATNRTGVEDHLPLLMELHDDLALDSDKL